MSSTSSIAYSSCSSLQAFGAIIVIRHFEYQKKQSSQSPAFSSCSEWCAMRLVWSSFIFKLVGLNHCPHSEALLASCWLVTGQCHACTVMGALLTFFFDLRGATQSLDWPWLSHDWHFNFTDVLLHSAYSLVVIDLLLWTASLRKHADCTLASVCNQRCVLLKTEKETIDLYN